MLSLLPGSTLTAPSFRLSHRERETLDEIGAELFPNHFLPIAKALEWGVGPSRARPHMTFRRSPLPAPVQPPWGPGQAPCSGLCWRRVDGKVSSHLGKRHSFRLPGSLRPGFIHSLVEDVAGATQDTLHRTESSLDAQIHPEVCQHSRGAEGTNTPSRPLGTNSTLERTHRHGQALRWDTRAYV